MKVISWLFCLFLLVVSAQSQAQVVESLRATLTDDPSSTMNIIWQAPEEDGKDHVFYYDTLDQGPDPKDYRHELRPLFTRYYKGMDNTYIRLRNLQPDQRYHFLIKTPNGVSRRFWFKTLPDSRDARLSLIAGGDSRTNHFSRQRGNHLVSKLRADAVFFDGDMTTFGTGWEWRQWFDHWQLSISPDGRLTPLVVARGNHEKDDRMMQYLFDTPVGSYYGLDFANGLFRTFVLNTEGVMGGDQLLWLDANLSHEKSQNADWRFAMYHVPMRPHTKNKTPGSHQYRYWAPLFEKHRVDLVMEGDSHVVKTTHPIVPRRTGEHEDGFLVDEDKGTVYIGEGTWGAPLRDNNNDRHWTRASGSFAQFKWMFVDRESIEIRTVLFENAYDVDYVRDDQRFVEPRGLELWEPENGSGSVVHLERRAAPLSVPYQEARLEFFFTPEKLLAGAF